MIVCAKLIRFAAVIEMRFETGDPKLQALEHDTFVGAGRFVLEGGNAKVEYRVSKVGWNG